MMATVVTIRVTALNTGWNVEFTKFCFCVHSLYTSISDGCNVSQCMTCLILSLFMLLITHSGAIITVDAE